MQGLSGSFGIVLSVPATVAFAAWIYAGGAHHTAFSYDLTAEQMGDWANAMGIETVYIDKDTNIRQLRNELRWNEAYYKFH